MAYDLTEFDAIPWTEADEARPDVAAPDRPEKLSDRGERVLKDNARVRETWDESRNGYPSDSERVFAGLYFAGHAGLSCEDATYLFHEFYSRPGKKKPHLSKLRKSLRAWQKGRETAEREEAGHSEETAVERESEVPGTGAGARETRKG